MSYSFNCLSYSLRGRDVDGRVMPSPAARCSWLRSSTAPSESMPASINGASASKVPPAVWLAISSTTSNNIAEHATARAAAAGILAGFHFDDGGTMYDRNAGTFVASPSKRPHCTGITPSSEDVTERAAQCPRQRGPAMVYNPAKRQMRLPWLPSADWLLRIW